MEGRNGVSLGFLHLKSANRNFAKQKSQDSLLIPVKSLVLCHAVFLEVFLSFYSSLQQ